MFSGLDPAVSTLLQGIFWAASAGGSAVLFGIWDRRRIARQEVLTGASLERKELSENWQLYINKIESDNDKKRARLEAADLQIEHLQLENNWVWTAYRKYERKAHDLRHEAIRRIWSLHIRIFGTDSKPDLLEELPSGYALYQDEKGTH